MDENGAQESGVDFYAQFNSIKALTKVFSNLSRDFPWSCRVLSAEPAKFGYQASSTL